MASKYTRTNYMKSDVIDNILEVDIVNNNWDLFAIKRPMGYFSVGRSFIGRPDLLSLTIFGKMDYYWILLKCNPTICDMWNDIKVGDIIRIPDIRDIEDFYDAIKFREKS